MNDRGLFEPKMEYTDPYKSLAVEIFGVPLEEVTSEMRNIAKTVHYRHLCGGGSLVGLYGKWDVEQARDVLGLKLYDVTGNLG